ncbi:MAG: hypothetical protein ACRD2L_12470 [Terriglobia bacterium]
MYDAAQFNGFAKSELDDRLFEDIWNWDIFNESDLHSAAYYYIRTYFAKRTSDNIFVRCEPQMRGKKPDIVVYDQSRPVYVLEFKMFPEPEIIDEAKIDADLEKLDDFIRSLDSIKWGFFMIVYDSDDDFNISDPRLRRQGLEKISVIGVNLRRKEGSGRRRTGYDQWRTEFDRLRAHHKKW